MRERIREACTFALALVFIVVMSWLSTEIFYDDPADNAKEVCPCCGTVVG